MVHKSPIQPDFNRYIPLAGEARGVERMTSQRYARETTVSAEKSRGEIERTLRHYGADQFLYGWEDGKGIIGFSRQGVAGPHGPAAAVDGRVPVLPTENQPARLAARGADP